MARQSKTARVRLLCGSALASITLWASAAAAQDSPEINIPPQSLATALYTFADQSGHQVMFSPELAGAKTTGGVAGVADRQEALRRLLLGTGLTFQREDDTFLIVRAGDSSAPQSGSAAGGGAEVEALIVTAQKREEDIQDVPIAISAFTQEALERSQIAGGPDLMTQVPNMTFTKTNFSSYSIQIRGIGTQAISATTDPAVAVAFNNTPFVRNRFFEQEFFDVERVEVLRGPQGTLYGRNATAGVVNLISAKPRFDFEAKLSGDVANYNSTRLEGMVNIPLVEDAVALRLAGAWTKRGGYVTNQLTGNSIDGRDLWSARASLRIAPTDRWTVDLIYEHFEEDDDRLRSGKQTCKKHLVTEVAGQPVAQSGSAGAGGVFGAQTYLSQGCAPASMYSDEAFQTPNGFSLPFYTPLTNIGYPVFGDLDPYASAVQSRDLRVIESMWEPRYQAKADVLEAQVSVDISDALTLTSETSYSYDKIFSTQDYNRFNTKPGAFDVANANSSYMQENGGVLRPDGTLCDPQIGCSDRLMLVDLSTAESQQFSQEIRLSSDFDGPMNFSIGSNFLRYDTEDKYYVFINSLSLGTIAPPPEVWTIEDAARRLRVGSRAAAPERVYAVLQAVRDPNSIDSLNDQGRNYFLSRNPYRLISYAVFGEIYYNLTPTLKVTGGLRWTVDKKHSPRIPSWLLVGRTYGDYPVAEVITQEWREPTGRLTVDWKPVDEILLYASYAHGYKAGGSNPPTPVFAQYSSGPMEQLIADAINGHPKTFDAEYIDAFEIGMKNTLLDGRLTLNLAGFYYDYEGYQISQIIDRSAINSNFDAEVWGAEIEVDWRPLENLRLGFKGGYEGTRVADGESAVDTMDRSAGDPNWVVVRPFPTVPSNCILPINYLEYLVDVFGPGVGRGLGSGPNASGACVNAYYFGFDPATGADYEPYPLPAYPDYAGFDPSTAPNGGAGISKDLSGNALPNAPKFTATITADYTVPLPNDWLMTLHTDLYYQAEAWTRIFNMEGYDKLKAYSNINFAAIFTNEEQGWNVMAYVKNVLDRDSITGAFLNSDDTGLTTNVFLTEPRLYGVRVTKSWSGGPLLGGFGERRDGPYPFTIELSGGTGRPAAESEVYSPDWIPLHDEDGGFPLHTQTDDLDWSDQRGAALSWRPQGGAWRIGAAMRYGRTNAKHAGEVQGEIPLVCQEVFGTTECFYTDRPGVNRDLAAFNWGGSVVRDRETHDLADLTIGRDVGLGAWGDGGSSTLVAGLRYASFRSESDLAMYSSTDDYLPATDAFKYDRDWHEYDERIRSDRRFEGVGPVVSWEASARLAGSEQAGWLDLDWSLGGGALFGRQETTVEGDLLDLALTGNVLPPAPPAGWTPTVTTIAYSRSERVTVPVASASLGLSYSIDRVKVGAGYRFDRFFDVIDGGIEERRQYDRTIDGPYFKIAVGFGG